jgi:hypothetical protein
MRTLVPAGLLVLFFGTVQAQEITLESAPPVVVKTVPEAGSAEVDPATTEVRVTFSKAMQDGSWSWSTASKETFPETTNKPKYAEDHRTVVMPFQFSS